jgi:transposase
MALLMVMGLSLLVYALAERFVRAALVKCEQTIENQVGKRTQRPTLRRIFQVFEGIDLLLTQQGNHSQRVVLNLNPIHHQILDLFGREGKKCYIPDE